MDRRQFLAISSAGIAASAAAGDEPSRIGLGFSLYGMRSKSVADACKICREIGYDSVELPVMADWPADALKITDDQSAEITETLSHHRLKLAGIMENLVLAADEPAHDRNLKRLRAACRLGRKLMPKATPVVETVLGGKPAEWDDARPRMAERLKDWARVAEEEQSVLAIKAHVSGAAHLPEHIVWLIDQVGSEHIKAAYDPSHFALRGLSSVDVWKTMAPHVAFVHFKDFAGTPEKPQFLLPGQGKLNFEGILREMAASPFSGHVVVEVSGQIHSKPDYDPVAAAKSSYEALAGAFKSVGISRRN